MMVKSAWLTLAPRDSVLSTRFECERTHTCILSNVRFGRSIQLSTEGSPVSPTNGIRSKVVVKRDESLAVQRRGQINYLPFCGGVSDEVRPGPAINRNT